MFRDDFLFKLTKLVLPSTLACILSFTEAHPLLRPIPHDCLGCTLVLTDFSQSSEFETFFSPRFQKHWVFAARTFDSTFKTRMVIEILKANKDVISDENDHSPQRRVLLESIRDAVNLCQDEFESIKRTIKLRFMKTYKLFKVCLKSLGSDLQI